VPSESHERRMQDIQEAAARRRRHSEEEHLRRMRQMDDDHRRRMQQINDDASRRRMAFLESQMAIRRQILLAIAVGAAVAAVFVACGAPARGRALPAGVTPATDKGRPPAGR
jgi:hypothetical protein